MEKSRLPTHQCGVNQRGRKSFSEAPEERVAAVDSLRKQRHGSTERLQRSVRVIKRRQFIPNKRALGRKKDLADLGALGEE